MKKNITETINTIKEIINQKTWLRNGEHSIILEENKADSKIKKLEINHLSSTFFGFKLDFFEPNKISEYFSSQISNINQGCDGLIFAEFEEKAYIICCEMKSSDKGNSDYFSQFQNTNCFIDFLEILLKEYHELDFEGFERKFILFYRDDKIKNPFEMVSMKNFANKSIKTIRQKHKIRKFCIKFSETDIPLADILRK